MLRVGVPLWQPRKFCLFSNVFPRPADYHGFFSRKAAGPTRPVTTRGTGSRGKSRKAVSEKGRSIRVPAWVAPADCHKKKRARNKLLAAAFFFSFCPTSIHSGFHDSGHHRRDIDYSGLMRGAGITAQKRRSSVSATSRVKRSSTPGHGQWPGHRTPTRAGSPTRLSGETGTDDGTPSPAIVHRALSSMRSSAVPINSRK